MLMDAIYAQLYVLSILFPDLTFPWDTEVHDLAVFVGSHLASINAVFPVSESLVVVSWSVSYLAPIMLTFLLVRWVYAHIPVIGSGS